MNQPRKTAAWALLAAMVVASAFVYFMIYKPFQDESAKAGQIDILGQPMRDFRRLTVTSAEEGSIFQDETTAHKGGVAGILKEVKSFFNPNGPRFKGGKLLLVTEEEPILETLDTPEYGKSVSVVKFGVSRVLWRQGESLE